MERNSVKVFTEIDSEIVQKIESKCTRWKKKEMKRNNRTRDRMFKIKKKN